MLPDVITVGSVAPVGTTTASMSVPMHGRVMAGADVVHV
eukprot:CAMPEP_0198327206 /NCGR_PEP_ID=MMETSP1450-20131203/14527_1 /TAXON_ID=753684 ORGANISM="Madagascaria erythrocladiodes, Strain CCMP3234" /NCGR_SAMPLE_ID=MMETSP1450 /ASSEMBLY_ACC=CAM_ASM_001115 /LENGTH=38 /DNA_ID= /DNA_START= /DNA_END= /DNA_ORIENTATION=